MWIRTLITLLLIAGTHAAQQLPLPIIQIADAGRYVGREVLLSGEIFEDACGDDLLRDETGSVAIRGTLAPGRFYRVLLRNVEGTVTAFPA